MTIATKKECTLFVIHTHMSHTCILHFRQDDHRDRPRVNTFLPRSVLLDNTFRPINASPRFSVFFFSLLPPFSHPRDRMSRLFLVRTGDQNSGYHVVRPHGFEFVSPAWYCARLTPSSWYSNGIEWCLLRKKKTTITFPCTGSTEKRELCVCALSFTTFI